MVLSSTFGSPRSFPDSACHPVSHHFINWYFDKLQNFVIGTSASPGTLFHLTFCKAMQVLQTSVQPPPQSPICPDTPAKRQERDAFVREATPESPTTHRASSQRQYIENNLAEFAAKDKCLEAKPSTRDVSPPPSTKGERI